MVDERQGEGKRPKNFRRWLIPGAATVTVGVIAAVILLVAATSNVSPLQTSAGPKNMISDGILFTGSDGGMVVTTTPAIPANGTPTSNPRHGELGIAHIVTYVDLTCPACKAFEGANADGIKGLVSRGIADLEVHPIAILDSHFTTGSTYSIRANNVVACVANFTPDSFYAVMQAVFIGQSAEGTADLTNAQLVRLVHAAGVTKPDVDRCISDEFFGPWVKAATSRALKGSLPNTRALTLTATPTVLVNGYKYDGSLTNPKAFDGFVSLVLRG